MTQLHLALQRRYAEPDGQMEALVAGFRVDVLRAGVIYEIQTGRFRAIRPKLEALAAVRPLVLVHPVCAEKRLVTVDPDTGQVLSERRSPKRGAAHDVFLELPSIARLLAAGALALEVVLTREREFRDASGGGSWRRHGVKRLDRELVEVLGHQRITAPSELLGLLPADLPEPFAVPDVQAALGVNTFLARKIAYALRHAGATQVVGKRSRLALYGRV